MLASPAKPVLPHCFDVAGVLRRHGLLSSDGDEGFEPEVGLAGKEAKDQRNCAPTLFFKSRSAASFNQIASVSTLTQLEYGLSLLKVNPSRLACTTFPSALDMKR